MKKLVAYSSLLIVWFIATSVWYTCSVRSRCVVPKPHIAIPVVKFTSPDFPTFTLNPSIASPTPKPGQTAPKAFNVFFEPDQTTFTADATLEAQLKSVGAFAKSHPKSVIQLTGHTANIGSGAGNDQIALARAEAVKTQLTQYGAAENQVLTASKGETSPLGDDNTEEGRARNRRVEVAIQNK
jgi:outer membrane protein OmpA-like peptidoglycan-associated protein